MQTTHSAFVKFIFKTGHARESRVVSEPLSILSSNNHKEK